MISEPEDPVKQAHEDGDREGALLLRADQAATFTDDELDIVARALIDRLKAGMTALSARMEQLQRCSDEVSLETRLPQAVWAS